MAGLAGLAATPRGSASPGPRAGHCWNSVWLANSWPLAAAAPLHVGRQSPVNMEVKGNGTVSGDGIDQDDLIAAGGAGCGKDECESCRSDADCRSGFVCSQFDDGQSRCGTGGDSSCPLR